MNIKYSVVIEIDRMMTGTGATELLGFWTFSIVPFLCIGAHAIGFVG
jgi:hypothetical protein